MVSTVATMVHEMAHADSGALDGEPAHAESMIKIAAEVTEDAMRGQYEEYMGKIHW